MKLTFLGTGTSQGVPVIGCDCAVCRSVDYRDKRLRASVHIQTEDCSLVIDTGPDFRQQMLRNRIRSLTAVLFTHQHKDHTAGMDDIRSFYFLQGKQNIPIYASQPVLDQLHQEFAYIFAEKKYPGVVSVDEHALDGQPFQIGQTTITPIEVLHYKLPVFGYRVGDITYITDANHIPEASIEKIKGSRVLVLNALHKERHLSHFSLGEAVAIAEQVGAEQTYFTHMGHNMGLHQDVNAELPEGIRLAYDGLSVELAPVAASLSTNPA